MCLYVLQGKLALLGRKVDVRDKIRCGAIAIGNTNVLGKDLRFGILHKIKLMKIRNIVSNIEVCMSLVAMRPECY